jgi:very-short-patch-repair endonuclease
MLEQARDGQARDINAFEAALNSAASKSVDFAIVDHAGGVMLVIELDNRSHDRPDRMRRDQEVRAVLAHCGVPLVRVRPGQRVEVGRHLLARTPGLVD